MKMFSTQKCIFYFTILIHVFAGYSQEYNQLFNKNSEYLLKGTCAIEATDTTSVSNYLNYKKIPYRTVAVDPCQILLGSIVFIPQFVGVKLSDGTFHDGYFLAHGVITDQNSSSVQIYIGESSFYQDDSTGTSTTPDCLIADVFVVRGIMDKVTRLHFSQEYGNSPEKGTHEMIARDFNKLMIEGDKLETMSQRIQFYSEKCKGTPYLIDNLGEGASQFPDPDPVIDFARMDCMTFCEHVLALSISCEYNLMYDNLQKIRYKNGLVRYVSRNHYTISEWLPNNDWLLEDATKEIGGNYTQKISKLIDRQAFYLKNGISLEQLKDSIPVQNDTAYYIPREDLLKIKDNLKGGEIVSIVTTIPGVISAHMGIIVKDEWGNIIFRHANSLPAIHEIMDQPFEEVVENLKKSPTRIGMIFMRAKDNYVTPK